jgi:signal transduction histidine kinase
MPIGQYAVSRARRLAVKISVAGFVLVFLSTSLGGILAYYSRLDYASQAMESGFIQAIVTGDTFQISRMVDSLSRSKGISAVALINPDNKKVISESGEVGLAKSVALKDGRFKYLAPYGIPSVALKHPIRDRGKHVGDLVIVSRLPLGPIAFTLVIFAAVFLGAGNLMVDAAKRTARAITGPAEDLARRLKTTSDWTSLHCDDLRFAELIEIHEAYGELSERLKQTAQQAAVGLVASRVRHDANQGLLALKLGIKRLMRSPSQADYDLATSALKRIESTIREIPRMNLAQERTQDFMDDLPTMVPANVTAEDAIELVRPLIREFSALAEDSGKRIEIELAVSSPQAMVEVEPVKFRRMMANILANSVQAITNAGRIIIAIRPTASSQIEILISDNGKGIPDSVISKIGEPGFTHGKPDGSGLGLSTAVSYVSHWMGSLTINSKEGLGTQVTISLPRYELS